MLTAAAGTTRPSTSRSIPAHRVLRGPPSNEIRPDFLRGTVLPRLHWLESHQTSAESTKQSLPTPHRRPPPVPDALPVIEGIEGLRSPRSRDKTPTRTRQLPLYGDIPPRKRGRSPFAAGTCSTTPRKATAAASAGTNATARATDDRHQPRDGRRLAGSWFSSTHCLKD